MRRLLLLTLAPSAALALACGYGDPVEETGLDDTADTADTGCPEGLNPSRQAALFLQQLMVDNVTVVWDFDPEGVYDGVPAACVSADGTQGQWIFTSNNLPYGRIALSAPDLGTFSPGEDEASLVVELMGLPEPVTYDDTGWTLAQLNALAIGASFEVSGNGQANQNGTSLVIQFSAEASR